MLKTKTHSRSSSEISDQSARPTIGAGTNAALSANVGDFILDISSVGYYVTRMQEILGRVNHVSLRVGVKLNCGQNDMRSVIKNYKEGKKDFKVIQQLCERTDH